ncbi:uncharacterized protein BP01DRAFT_381168 [Aspergillus saccharolyticus JOP 1030-1]|uniref:Uncharacterized protein n=1 Tax=Aspergillus saccharolyticus JOP 1030-1 TaxID=1450539 RepID=A0A318ZIX5_9EURO|nr:hypothetical protein BP01DRAFT_381168 [Aspergillus saccharolyticus JOP 1030-1]PYH46737.1 hypothetical protein BP01DRAFT_381168 [Aspergillus saccharolyticus JOP 1030-1]
MPITPQIPAPTPPPPPTSPHLSANFNRNHTVDYDHEVYLELITNKSANPNSSDKDHATVSKTPNQIYRENLVRRQTTRALDLAVLDPVGHQDPSPVDLEWAERERVRERVVGS